MKKEFVKAVLAGTEHCVANMFCFTMAPFDAAAIPYVLGNTAANAAGGLLLCPLVRPLGRK